MYRTYAPALLSVASYTESFRNMKSMSKEMFPAWFVGFAIDAAAMTC